MRDQDGGLAVAEFFESLEHFKLGASIKRRGRLVENQHARFAHIGPGDRNFLPFATGKFHTVLKSLANHLLIAGRQSFNYLVSLAARRRTFDAVLIVAGGNFSNRDIVASAEIVTNEILEDDAHITAQGVEVIFAQVVAIQQDTTFVWIVKAREKFNQCGLSCAILSDEREYFAGMQCEGKMANGPSFGVRIPESDIVKNEAFANRL